MKSRSQRRSVLYEAGFTRYSADTDRYPAAFGDSGRHDNTKLSGRGVYDAGTNIADAYFRQRRPADWKSFAQKGDATALDGSMRTDGGDVGGHQTGESTIYDLGIYDLRNSRTARVKIGS
jgi:hypothetical protein